MSSALIQSTPQLPTPLASAIRLVVLDVDGVLTDGGLYMGCTASGDSVELKRFDSQDGLGIKMLMWGGLSVAVVSGRVSESTALRCRELGIEECHQDAGAEKLPIVASLIARQGIEWAQVAMVADDLADLPVLRRVGLPVAVANAVGEVRDAASWCASKEGGRGAVREFSEALLRSRGEWDRLVQEYCRARGEG